jgi:hypothetical protein
MIPNFLRPQTQHAIEWYGHTEEIGDHKHMLRLNPKIFLEIPKSKRARSPTSRLAMPRYVTSRNENETMLFWMMLTRLPVVLSHLPEERKRRDI